MTIQNIYRVRTLSDPGKPIGSAGPARASKLSALATLGHLEHTKQEHITAPHPPTAHNNAKHTVRRGQRARRREAACGPLGRRLRRRLRRRGPTGRGGARGGASRCPQRRPAPRRWAAPTAAAEAAEEGRAKLAPLHQLGPSSSARPRSSPNYTCDRGRRLRGVGQ